MFIVLILLNFQTGEPPMKNLKLIDAAELTDVQYKAVKKDLAMRNNTLKNVPRFRLKFYGEKASLLTASKARQPLMLDDIQHLLMSALIGSNSPFRPDRWCVLEKANKVVHTVVLVIEGLTSYSFMSNESLFVKTKAIFDQQLEVVLPNYQKNNILEELSCVPLTQSYKQKLIEKYGSLEAAMNLNKDHHLIAKSVFPIDGEITDEDSLVLHEGETFPRTRLLLSPLQMMIEGYPMPIKGEFEERYREFKFTREHYKPVTSKSPMFGVDCEMCRTVKAENELARVSIVDENYESVYETLVRPANKITDYLTPWSGITKEMMEDVTKTLKQVQEEIRDVLPPDAILVGQSLNCDLNAMKLMHPYVIDTSVIFNISGDRNRKSKLQHLAKHFLDEEIQMDVTLGHSSIEDSTASLKLTKLKLSKDIYFGDVALSLRKNIEERTTYTGVVSEPTDSSKPLEVATTLFTHAFQRRKKSAIVTTHSSELDLEKFYSKNQYELLKKAGDENEEMSHGIKHHKEGTAKKVISKMREIILDNDFNLSHFNALEDSLHEGDGSSENTTVEEKISKVIPQIDKWIEKVWDAVASNGLFVVIFGGHETSTNGLSMFKIKN